MTFSILLAEDTEDISRLVQKGLEKAGYECTAVTNGKEAVEIFESKPFDLIVMDGNMPVMDGFEAIKMIRTLEVGVKRSRRRIPIILHSALTGWEVRQKLKECGIDEFVPKSTMKALIATVKRYLG